MSARRRLAACAGLTLLLRLPSLIRPIMDIDEASYAAIACRMLAGGLPYRDGVENKPPGIYYVYEWVFALFGRYDMLALHVVTAAVALATALVLAAIARTAVASSDEPEGAGADANANANANANAQAPAGDGGAGERAAWLAAIGYTVYSTTYYPKMLAANTEMFLVLPASLAVLLYLRARGRAWPLVTAGALVALATLLKQVAGLLLAALLADAARQVLRTRRPVAVLRASALVLAGFALPLVLLWLWYRRLGIFDDAVFWVVTYIMKYYLPARNQSFAFNLLEYLAPFLLLVSPLVVLASRARPFSRHALLWLWLGAMLAAALVGGRMYGHYFLMFVPPLCVLAAVGGAPLFAPIAVDGAAAAATAMPAPLATTTTARARKAPWPRRFFVAATPLLALGSLAPALVYEPATESFFRRDPDYLPVTEYVRAHTTRDDGIFVWGWFPPLYVQSDRCPATRFPTVHVLAGAAEGTRGHSVPRGWEMLLDDLGRAPPRLILDTSPGDYHFAYAHLDRYPPLAAYVHAHYHDAGLVAGVRIWARND